MMDFSCFFTPLKLVFISFKNEYYQEGDILKLDMLKGQKYKKNVPIEFWCSGARAHL